MHSELHDLELPVQFCSLQLQACRYSEEALESCVKLASQYIQETAAVRGWDYCLCGVALG